MRNMSWKVTKLHVDDVVASSYNKLPNRRQEVREMLHSKEKEWEFKLVAQVLRKRSKWVTMCQPDARTLGNSHSLETPPLCETRKSLTHARSGQV
jgi:hypothetical protein